MESFNRQCPFCGHHSVVTAVNFVEVIERVWLGPKHGQKRLAAHAIICPNNECQEYSLTFSLLDEPSGMPEKRWRLVPESAEKVFPSYIPKPLLDDYREACLIVDKSPKASATLSRRCLQGMIRHFWDVKKDNLKQEIDAIHDKVDGTTWDAIDSLRKMGNIGAHMENDINLIVDVDPEESAFLIQLLETLFKDWYIAKHDREERMKKIKDAATAKDAAKKGGTTTP